MIKDCTPAPNLQRLYGGVLVHLAHYLDNGCHRSAYLARMVLEQLAQSNNDHDLGREIDLLMEILESRIDQPTGRTPTIPATLVHRDCVHPYRISV